MGSGYSINDAIFPNKLGLQKSSAYARPPGTNYCFRLRYLLSLTLPLNTLLFVQGPYSYGGAALILVLLIFGRQYPKSFKGNSLSQTSVCF